MTLNLKGKVSWFGGPDDTGVAPDEGLAFIYDVNDAPDLFLSYQPEGTTGLARRLNPDTYYVACRWDYSQPDQTKTALLEEMALIRAPKTGKSIKVYPADWGPHQDTDRIADVSPATLKYLGIETDDQVEIIWPFTKRGGVVAAKPFPRIVMSSGHSTKCQGAVGILNEVKEATRVVDRTAELLRKRGVDCKTFHDTSSTSQNENLHKITDYHNAQKRDLDVSVHFNANVETTSPMGTECLWVTQETLADHVANTIATCGFKNRGAKYRSDLWFLNQTMMPSILIEVCFVDSSADADLYLSDFAAVCEAIANVLGGPESSLEIAKPKGEII